MKTINRTLSIRNSIVRNCVSDRYYSIAELLFNPAIFILFLVDLIDNHC